jgi:hypothetical protein
VSGLSWRTRIQSMGHSPSLRAESIASDTPVCDNFSRLLWDGQQVTLLAEYPDHRPAFQAVESLGFCPRRSAARKCRGQRQSGDRSRPWTGKADRSTCDFPSFRLKREHYCRRRVDSHVGSTAEKAPAAQLVGPTALAQSESRVLRPLLLKR